MELGEMHEVLSMALKSELFQPDERVMALITADDGNTYIVEVRDLKVMQDTGQLAVVL